VKDLYLNIRGNLSTSLIADIVISDIYFEHVKYHLSIESNEVINNLARNFFYDSLHLAKLSHEDSDMNALGEKMNDIARNVVWLATSGWKILKDSSGKNIYKYFYHLGCMYFIL